MGDIHDESEGSTADRVAQGLGGEAGDGREVATALAVTVRQVWRLKRRFEAAGAAGLLHRSRGRPSLRRLAARLRQRVATLLTTTYRDFNDCRLARLNVAFQDLTPVSRYRSARRSPRGSGRGPSDIRQLRRRRARRERCR